MVRLPDNRGNVAFVFALLAPVLLVAAGGAVDFQSRGMQKDNLQGAADSLATRGAREFLLENATAAQIEALVEATADAQYSEDLGDFELVVEADNEHKSVKVSLRQSPNESVILTHIEAFRQPLTADATAVARGSTNVCVIALEGEGQGAIKAENNSILDAAKCSILSNSTSSTGIDVSGTAQLKGSLICSAGGTRGGMSNFTPQALTDCPVYDDPLAERMEPEVGACDATDSVFGEPITDPAVLMGQLLATLAVIDGSKPETLPGYTRHDIEPGVYCGGVHIKFNADVHLAPGVYIIKGGPLVVEFGGRLYGEGVGFFFTDDNAYLEFQPASIVHLKAPTDGLMAGLLFFEDRDAKLTRPHAILSSNARTLLGTIYFPQSRLHIQSLMPIADESAYTAIVARQLSMKGSPRLVLNADYAATDVPVPDGIGPSGGQVFLRQ